MGPREGTVMSENKNKKALWIVLAVLIAVLLVFGGYMLASSRAHHGPVTVNSTPSYEFEEGQSQNLEEGGVTPGIEIPGYTVIPVKANTKDVEVDLFNPENNNVYFQITLSLTDTEEVLFESKMIEPGDHLYNIELTRPLDPGEYDMTIQYSTFTTDGEFTPRNGATMICILRAE